MAIKEKTLLVAQKDIIKNETIPLANTAQRNGLMLEDVIDSYQHRLDDRQAAPTITPSSGTVNVPFTEDFYQVVSQNQPALVVTLTGNVRENGKFYNMKFLGQAANPAPTFTALKIIGGLWKAGAVNILRFSKEAGNLVGIWLHDGHVNYNDTTFS